MKAITIIGGGLAGLSLGIRLRQMEIPVTLHEAGRLPRHRVCGEFMTGLGDSVVESLGLPAVLTDALELKETQWFFRDTPVLKRRLPRRAIGLSRHVLDQRMAKLFIDDGGVVKWNSRYKEEGKEGLVMAAGRRPDSDSPWIGLKAHFHNMPLETDLELHLGKAGYAGASPVENGATNVCGLFRKREGPTFSGPGILVAYLRANGLFTLAERIEASECDESSRCAVAGLNYRFTAPAVECALGDRLGLIPPFTGHGMAIALESGTIAAGPIAEYSRGNCDWREAVIRVRTQLGKRFARRIRSGRLLHHLVLNISGQRLLRLMARANVLPFNSLYQWTHR